MNAKENILKEARRKKHLTYRAARIKITLDFSTETTHARREWNEIFTVLRENNPPTNLEFCTLQHYPLKEKEK